MKIIKIAAAITIILAFCANSVAAVSPGVTLRGVYKNLIILGDSISTGYGLPGGGTISSSSYANLLARELGIITGAEYDNYAVDGATSAMLVRSIAEYSDRIAKADLIVVSIGGNDVLKPILETLTTALQLSTIDLDFIRQHVAGADLTSAFANFNSEITKRYYNQLTSAYKNNLTKIAADLRTVNPGAKIIFIGLFNPLDGVPEYESLLPFTGSVIDEMDRITREVSETGEFEMLELCGEFSGRGLEYTNIDANDIHPNMAGHEKIYDMLFEMLAADLPDPPQTSAVSESADASESDGESGKEKDNSNFMVYAVAAIAVLGGAFIGNFASKKNRKKNG